MSTQRRFRAWRFGHPDFDRSEGRDGLRIAPSGAVDMVDGDGAVRQALLLLLTTRPGERVMLPTYGCDLDHLLFAPNDDTTAGLAVHYVRQAIARWETRLDVIRLDATRSREQPFLLDITLKYRVRPTLNEEQLTLQLNLMGHTF